MARTAKKRLSDAEWYAANREDQREKHRAYYRANRKRILAHNAEHRRETRAKENARQRRRYAADPERHRKWQRDWAEANPEKVRELNRQSRARNPRYGLRWQRANRDKVRSYSAKWAGENLEYYRAAAATRRALKRKAKGRIGVKEQRRLLAESLGLCAYCNERVKVTLDHIEPLSKGGEHDVDNVAPACKSCNSEKHDSSLLLFLARRAQKQSSQKAA